MATTAPRVKLAVPKEWKDVSGHCYLVYDESRRLIKVVSIEEPDNVLHVVDPDDLIGVGMQVHLTGVTKETPSEEPNEQVQDTQGQAVLTLYTYPREPKTKCKKTNSSPRRRPKYERPTDLTGLGNRQAQPLSFLVTPQEDLQECSELVSSLKQAAGILESQKYLIIVNPCAGPKRNGEEICKTIVQPMLDQANIEYQVVVTTHPKHATEYIAGEAKLLEYHGIVTLGGDGIVHEIVNGMMQRPDRTAVFQKLKIGIVGTGTANGLATSIAHQSNEGHGPLDETFLICKGKAVRTDLSEYQTLNHSYTSFLTFSWAFVADVDIESEKIHFLGEARFDVWAVLRILFLRTYRARFSYLPASCSPGTMPPLSDPVPSDWVSMEENFVLFWASQVSHGSRTVHQSPASRLNDEIFTIFVIKAGISRLRLIQMLLSMDSGGHTGIPGAEFIQCRAFRLEPRTPGSFNDVDGEPVEDGPIQAQVQPGAMQVFCNE
jgi:sphingosine kinase